MADLAALPGPSMDWHASDAVQAFKRFMSLCELMFTGPLSAKSEEEKVKYLLIWAGAEAIELVSTWELTAEQKKELELGLDLNHMWPPKTTSD